MCDDEVRLLMQRGADPLARTTDENKWRPQMTRQSSFNESETLKANRRQNKHKHIQLYDNYMYIAIYIWI